MTADDSKLEQTDPLQRSIALLARNHDELLAVLRSGERAGSRGDGHRGIGLALQRFIRDRATNQTVPYTGEKGAGALLPQLALLYPGSVVQEENGNPYAFSGQVEVDGEAIPYAVSLQAGAQLEVAAGPTARTPRLLAFLQEFDRNFHVAAREMGCDYDLVAEGYNPMVQSALDVSLVPRTEFGLLNIHLSKTGRHGRDAMRVCASTKVVIDYGSEADAIQTYRLAVAVAPLIMFLTDNSKTFRGSDPRHTTRMLRSRIWDDVDPERCGIVPGTFDEGFSFQRYVDWLLTVHPVSYSDGLGACTATNKQTIADVMQRTALSGSELMSLFAAVYPDVRLKRYIEFLQADSLRPRTAVAYATFIKGLFYNDQSFQAACDLFRGVTAEDVSHAKETLRLSGWNGAAYGVPVPDLVQRLVDLARAGLTDPAEKTLLDEIALPWEVRMVPRDALVRNAG